MTQPQLDNEILTRLIQTMQVLIDAIKRLSEKLDRVQIEPTYPDILAARKKDASQTQESQTNN